eukprot:SAG11_NODE_565_length_8503_cov_20.810209_4_plen_148_part_00
MAVGLRRVRVVAGAARVARRGAGRRGAGLVGGDPTRSPVQPIAWACCSRHELGAGGADHGSGWLGYGPSGVNLGGGANVLAKTSYCRPTTRSSADRAGYSVAGTARGTAGLSRGVAHVGIGGAAAVAQRVGRADTRGGAAGDGRVRR